MLEFTHRKWEWCLAFGAIIFLIINCYIFYPGFMSYDTLQQLAQAEGMEQYFNWHPPVMAFLWSVGIAATGKIASFLIFQMILLWASLLICGIVVYKQTNSRLYSVLPLLFGYLPFIVSISGVIWKDVQMAFALFLASCLAIAAGYAGRKMTILLGVVGSLCIIYALMLRYNAVFAVLPILYMFVVSLVQRKQVVVVIMLGVILLALGANFVLNRSLDVRESNPTTAIMLDDVVHTVPASQINSAPISPSAKTDLIKVKSSCDRNSVLIHALLYCTDSQQQAQKIQYHYFNDLSRLWRDIPLNNFNSYLSYRSQTFFIFLTSPSPYTYVMHGGIDPNAFGQEVSHRRATDFLKGYVEGFANHDFGFMFRPYFWLIASVGIFLYAVKQRAIKYRRAVICLTLSATIYILGYIPFVIGADYRYVYWSVIATCLATMLVFIGRRKR